MTLGDVKKDLNIPDNPICMRNYYIVFSKNGAHGSCHTLHSSP